MPSLPVPPPQPQHELHKDESKSAGIGHRSSENVLSDEDSGVDLRKEIYDTSAIDPILAKKMALVNNAIDEIGMTPWQWKLFCLNGFGYAVDSVRLWLICDSFL